MDELRRYFSSLARVALATPPGPAPGFHIMSIDCAVLFIDVSGYTKLTQHAMRAGPESIERFSAALNSYFCRLIDLVIDQGGDVIAFAGDAIIALFRADTSPLAGAVARAARCGMAARALETDIAALGHPPDTAPVRSRITLTCGAAWLAVFGRDNRRRHVLVAGEAFGRLASSHGTAPPGSVAVDMPACLLLGARARFIAVHGAAPDTVRTLATLQADEDPDPLQDAEIDLPLGLLLRCLPSAIAERIANRQTQWLVEMRFVCPIFISFRPAPPEQTFEVPQIIDCILSFEDELIRFGGELRQVLADEHGFVVVGMFGTPGYTHEDDALRATLAACAVGNSAKHRGIRVSVGVSSGPALCGLYGNARRQDYVILGEVMNLAARLMQRQEGVLSDQATTRLAGPNLDCLEAGVFSLKGFAQPVNIMHLTGRNLQPSNKSTVYRHASEGMAPEDLIGRSPERTQIDARLLSHQVRRLRLKQRTLLIEGDAGMGKSALIRFACRKSRHLGLPTILAAGSRIESLTPYYVWRSIIPRLLAPAEVTVGPTKLAELVLSSLTSAPELLTFAPLLCDVLPLDIGSSEIIGQMEPSARATMTARLLLHLLASTATESVVIALEDAHWIDSASWSIIVQISQFAPNLLLLLTIRADSAFCSSEAGAFIEQSRPQGIHLAGLSESDIAEIVSVRLGARHTAPDIARFIRDRSAGNPFFAEELALALRERGQLTVEAGTCIARFGLDRFARLGLPNTVRATILERLDRLSAQQQRLLKIASVIGVVAPMRALVDIFGAEADASLLSRELDAIQDRQLADVAQSDGECAVCFRHAITQEAAYDMLTPSQKLALHKSVARWYEQTYTTDLDRWLPLLAHHFRAAHDHVKALLYLVRAGEQALQAHANSEAVHFLSGSIALENELSVAQLERIQRRRMLAEAHLKLSNLTACRQQLLEALSLSGHPVPQSAVGLSIDLARAVLHDFIIGARARSAPVSTAKSYRATLLSAQLHQLRAEVAYFEHDTLALLHGTFVGLRHAGAVGPSRELATAHATAAIVTGLLRLQRMSRRHLAAASHSAASAGHAPTAAYVQHLACVCASAIGDWDSAERAIGLAAEGYRRVGDLYRWQSTRMILAYQALHRGEFEKIEHYLIEADERAMFPSGPLQLRIWFRTSELARANALTTMGMAVPPPTALVEEVQMLAEVADPSQALLCRGFAADALRIQKDFVGARRQAELGLAVLCEHRPTTYFSLFGIVSIGEAFVSIAEHEAIFSSELRRSAQLALRALKRFALIVPIARPCMLLLQGRAAVLEGRLPQARKRFGESMSRSANLGMKGVESRAGRALQRLDGTVANTQGDLGWA
jgi:class 3 adenylate cyclase